MPGESNRDRAKMLCKSTGGDPFRFEMIASALDDAEKRGMEKVRAMNDEVAKRVLEEIGNVGAIYGNLLLEKEIRRSREMAGKK